MRILITGASSRVGESLASAFSPGNELLLLGRNRQRLQAVGSVCVERGAVSFHVDEVDIATITEEAWKARIEGVELIIHAAFFASRVRDHLIEPEAMNRSIAANITSPFGLFRAVAGASDSGNPRSVILISSFLTGLRSPDRLIYGSLKLLQEEYVGKLAKAHPRFHALVVRICTTIPVSQDSPKSRKLAQCVLAAHNSRKERVTFGLAGRLFVFLFHLQPMIYYTLTSFQRWLRSKLS